MATTGRSRSGALFVTMLLTLVVGLFAPSAASADPYNPAGAKIKFHSYSSPWKTSVVCQNGERYVIRRGDRSPCQDTRKMWIPRNCWSTYSIKAQAQPSGTWIYFNDFLTATVRITC